MKRNIITLSVLYLFLPVTGFAGLEITEIMYDPKGSDTGREWIEVLNVSDQPIRILGGSSNNSWRLFEKSASGNLAKRTFLFPGSSQSITVPANKYLIIANNEAEFLKDYPRFSGLIVSSRISLTNSEGREIVIVDENENQVSDVVEYVPVEGLGNTGASLQKQSSGNWIPALPTPGEVNSSERFVPEDDEGGGEGGGGSSEKDEYLNLESDWPFTDDVVYVNAGENVRVFVGEEARFSGEARLRNGDEPRRAKFSWAFGDGGGDSRSVGTHSYRRAGTYNVVLTVEYEGRVYRDRIRVQVIDRDIVSLGEVGDDYVEVKNTTDREVDISGWSLLSGEERMEFALGTHLLPRSIIGAPLDVRAGNSISLLDTKGVTVALVGGREIPVGFLNRQGIAETLEVIVKLLEEMKSKYI